MSAVFDVLESKGLLSEKHASRIEGLSGKDTVRLYEKVYAVVFNAQNEWVSPGDRPGDLDPFTFLAGASVRGDSTCWEPQCRMQKLDFLGRYAALYANEVTVPLPLTHSDNLHGTVQAKNLLSLSAMTLLRLRPLITQGIVKPAVLRTTHCVHTIKWVSKMTKFVHEFGNEMAKRSMADFKVVYQIPEKAPGGLSSVDIEGPRDFLEHGNIVMTFNEDSNWRARTWKYDDDGKIELRAEKKL
jgi:hypothetical protein